MNNNNSNLWGHISELLFSVELFSGSFPTFLAVFVCSLDKCNKNEKKKASINWSCLTYDIINAQIFTKLNLASWS